MRIEVDRALDVLYAHVGTGAVTRTRELPHGVLVDLTDDGTVVGVELLTLGGPLPGELEDLLDSCVIERLRAELS